MKKFILVSMFTMLAVLSVYAADEKKLSEVVAVEYNSTILDVEDNDLKVNDSVLLLPAGESEGIVTAVEGSIVIVSLNNNGFAEGSKILLNNADRLGKAGAKQAVVKAVKLNSLILDVKNNSFKVQDRVSLEADGSNQAKVTSVNGNIVILSINDSGYAEGSKLLIKKGKERFVEKMKK
ncbi:MAG: hypothetical protein MSA07_04955 [Mucispirillum sp.]|uniref:Uncharacterized protein n=1 Tax=Candidatus Mucispirillum faecigallinarum TaxID=2838699 RepID=A0A9D2GRF2_9BACT|nr:hypothetical protein [Mucispirillum sp.]HIZ88668.1 hypothetical protein [Candidatus Mucispirillum faecigallinarum]